MAKLTVRSAIRYLPPTQMTAAEVYEAVTRGGGSDFTEVVAILNRHQPWCLIGGLAVNCYVEPVYTIDADFVVVMEELDPVAAELQWAGFTVKRFQNSLNAQRGGSELRAQFTMDQRYQQFLAGLERHEVLGTVVPVATLENVVRGKIWAWQDSSRRVSKRKKDELDLLRIAEDYPALREKIPTEILEQLK